MMRVDNENSRAIPAECAERLLAEIRGRIELFDLIVVSDYFKGVCAGDIIPELIGLARSAGARGSWWCIAARARIE